MAVSVRLRDPEPLAVTDVVQSLDELKVLERLLNLGEPVRRRPLGQNSRLLQRLLRRLELVLLTQVRNEFQGGVHALVGLLLPVPRLRPPLGHLPVLPPGERPAA